MDTKDSKQCPICHSKDSKLITEKGDLFTDEKSYLCLNCGLGFLHPRMSDEEIKEYYLADTFSNDFRAGAEPTAEKRKKSIERAQAQWEAIRGTIGSGGKLLEIGCSSGEFLSMAPKGFDLYGIDPSTGYAQSQATSRADVRVGYFPEESFAGEVDKFDLIALFHTLEHMPDPEAVLAGVYDRLADDGWFVLEYPDLERASHRPKLSSTYFQKSHLYDFSLFNIEPLLNKHGFKLDFFAAYEQYPMDKNMLLLCSKIDDDYQPLTYDQDRAKSLYERLSTKLDEFFIIKHAPFRVIHFASHNINIGDGAITTGIRRVMSELSAEEIDFFNIDIVNYDYTGREVTARDILEIQPDLVLVGGGGTIDGHSSRALTGTAFMMHPEEMIKSKAKFGFVGLGHNAFKEQEFYNVGVLSDFIDFCKINSFPFSVRMDRSFERLEDLLERNLSEHVYRIPDPGFFVGTGGDPIAYSPWNRKKVMAQVAFDAYKNRFGMDLNKKELDEALNNFSYQIGSNLQNLYHEYEPDIMFALHTLDDIVSTSFVTKYMDHRFKRMFVRTTPVAHPLYAPVFFKSYEDADLVIGMRGHSIICAAGLGTPVIAIDTHDKIAGFMDEINCQEWCLSPSDEYFVDKLSLASTELVANPEQQLSIVREATSDWHDRIKNFLVECLRGVA